jgi:molecular chaperone GrpE
MFSKNKKVKNEEKDKVEKNIKSEKIELNEEKKEEMIELSETEKLEKQAAEYLDGWKRCQADFENYKKRQAEAVADMARYANESLLLQIIPVLDNFHASTDHVPEDQKKNAWVVGIMHIQKQLEQILKDNGVTEIKAKAGDDFDPKFHEAVSDEKVKDEKEIKNKIAKVIQRGYELGERVIRPARVVVE